MYFRREGRILEREGTGLMHALAYPYLGETEVLPPHRRMAPSCCDHCPRVYHAPDMGSLQHHSLKDLTMVSHNYQPLLVLDKSSSNFSEDLCAVISREDFDGCISTLPADELEGIIDYLDEVPFFC